MTPLKNLPGDFKKATEQMKQLHEKDLLRYAGVEGVKLVKDNFIRQEFVNGGDTEAWKARPEWVNKIYDTNPNYKGSYVKGSNPIATQTGFLMNSNNYEVISKKVLIGTNTNEVPYAKTINEGGESYWAEAGRTINIIARKFLPVTSDEHFIQTIWNRAKKKYDVRIDQIMSKFKK